MTIFSKIIAGEIPSYKIAESDKFFAFLDIFPLVQGHVLVVPKVETDITAAIGKGKPQPRKIGALLGGMGKAPK